MPSVSDYIKLSADETIIKEYRGFEMLKPQKASLHIAVTSKRLIFYGLTKAASKMNRPSLTQEIKIEDIRGLEIYEKRTGNKILFAFGALVCLAGLFGIYSPTTSLFFKINQALGNQLYGGLLVSLAGLIFILISFVAGPKVTAILLKGKNENLNAGLLQEKTIIKWGRESQRILCELGSVILDIQDKGKVRGVLTGVYNSDTDYDSYDNTSYEKSAGYDDYQDNDYDEVFEEKYDFKSENTTENKTENSVKEEIVIEEMEEKTVKEEKDYSDVSDISDISNDISNIPATPIEEQEIGKALGTGNKRDDYLF